jgi:hypothetical protein
MALGLWRIPFHFHGSAGEDSVLLRRYALPIRAHRASFCATGHGDAARAGESDVRMNWTVFAHIRRH